MTAAPMPLRTSYETLFHRHAGNPILTAKMWPYPAHTVFNGGDRKSVV